MKFSKYYFSLLNSIYQSVSKRHVMHHYRGPIKKYTYNILFCLVKSGFISRIQYSSQAKGLRIYFNYNKYGYSVFRQLKFISTNTKTVYMTVNQLIFLQQRYPLDTFIIYSALNGFLTQREAIEKNTGGILVLKIIY